MDLKTAQKIVDQAEAAKKVIETHRRRELENAYKQFSGFSNNEELIAALKRLPKAAKKSAKRARTKVSAELVDKIKSLAESGGTGVAIAHQVGVSYVTALKAIKGKYDKLLKEVKSKEVKATEVKATEVKAPKPRAPRKSNNVKLSDLTDKEKALITKAKSYKDITKLPRGTKNSGKTVMYAVYASIKGVGMKGKSGK